MSSRVSKFTYRSFIHITYNSSNPDHQYRSQIAFTSATGARPFHGSFNVIIPRVVCSFSSKGLLFFLKLFMEYSSFWRWNLITGLQILRLVYEFLLFLFGVTVETSHSNVGRRWYQWESSHNHLFVVLFYPGTRTEENNAVASSLRSTPNNDTVTTNLSVTGGFIFPNGHSQYQQQQQSSNFG